MRLAALLALLVAAPAPEPGPAALALPPEVVDFYGKRGVELLRRPGRVEVFRVFPEEPPKGDHVRLPRMGGFPALARGRLSPDLARRLSGALLAGETYGLPDNAAAIASLKLCGGFQPGIGYRFWRTGKGPGPDHLDVLLCFVCDDVGVVVEPGLERKAAPWEGEPGEAATGDIGPGRLALLELAAESLPGDPTFALLLARERRERAARSAFREALPPELFEVIDAQEVDRQGARVEDLESLKRITREAAGRVSPAPLLRGAFRALGATDERWDSYDREVAVVSWAAEVLGPGEFLAGLEAARPDPVALRGAARLFFERGWAARLPRQEAVRWAPLLARASLRGGAPGEGPQAARALAGFDSPEARALLAEAARGELKPAPDAPAPDVTEPSTEAAAFLSLAELGDGALKESFRHWLAPQHGAHPPAGGEMASDEQAIRAGLALLGEPAYLVPAVFSGGSKDTFRAALLAVERYRGAEGLDALYEGALAEKYSRNSLEAALLLERLSGRRFGGESRLPLQFEDDARTWWKTEGAAFVRARRADRGR